MMQNPYSGKNFFEFFGVLFSRLKNFLSGQEFTIAADEVQLIVLALLALSSALVGALLVMRKMTMLANSLSHTILLGIVIAYLLLSSTLGEGVSVMGSMKVSHLFLASLIMALITTFLTEFLTKVIRLQEDASIGLVFTALFALGIVLVTMYTRNVHIGAEVIMGNVDALHLDDIKTVFWIGCLNLFLCLLFFRGFFSTTFDVGFSKTIGISPSFFHYLLMMQTSITLLGAFRAVGVFLVLSMLVGPVLIGRFLTNNFKKLLFLSVVIGVTISLISVALSRHVLSEYQVALSTSGLMITLIFITYVGMGVKMGAKRMKFN